MNIFGIGTMELAVIFLVAIIALGPGKTMETARTLGRIMREARRTFTEVMDAASLNDTAGRRQPDAANQNTANPDNSPSGPPPDAAQRRPPDTPLPTPPHLAEQQDSPENTTESAANPGSGARPAD